MAVSEPHSSGRARLFSPIAVIGVSGVGLILLPLVLDLVDRATVAAGLALISAILATAGALVAPWTHGPSRGWLTVACLAMLLVVAVATTRELGAAWHNVWLLLSISVGATLGPALTTLAVAAVTHGSSPLTPRERDVLAAASDGSTVADISQRTYLSPSTVRNYLSEAIGKTGSRNRMEAVRVAREKGWL